MTTHQLIADNGFAIIIFPLAIMISGLAIMIFVLAQGIFWKCKVKPIMAGFTWFHPSPSPAIALFIGLSRVGETGEWQKSYLLVELTLAYTWFRKRIAFIIFALIRNSVLRLGTTVAVSQRRNLRFLAWKPECLYVETELECSPFILDTNL